MANKTKVMLHEARQYVIFVADDRGNIILEYNKQDASLVLAVNELIKVMSSIMYQESKCDDSQVVRKLADAFNMKEEGHPVSNKKTRKSKEKI